MASTWGAPPLQSAWVIGLELVCGRWAGSEIGFLNEDSGFLIHHLELVFVRHSPLFIIPSAPASGSATSPGATAPAQRRSHYGASGMFLDKWYLSAFDFILLQAVTSCTVNNSNSHSIGGLHVGIGGLGGGIGQHSLVQSNSGNNCRRSDNLVDFLQIDPQLSFNAASNVGGGPNRSHFEDLPENFLETISPQQQGGNTTQAQQQVSAAASMQSGTDGGGYATLISMPAPSHYANSLKMEAMEQHLGNHTSQLVHHSQGASLLDKARYASGSFGSGTAGLLSPLQLLQDGRSGGSLTVTGDPQGVHNQAHHATSVASLNHHPHHRSNGGSGAVGRTSDMLSGIGGARRVSYIKEEIGSDGMGNFGGGGQPTPQDLERMANAETPPALSNVEIASSILASLAGESPSSPTHQQISPQEQQNQQQQAHFLVHHMQQQSMQQQSMQQQQSQLGGGIQHEQQLQANHRPRNNNRNANKSGMKNDQGESEGNTDAGMNLDFGQQGTSGNGQPQQQQRFGPMGPGAGVPRAVYSTSDTTDPLNAEIDDEIYIDTKDLCKRVAYELKQHSIPQAIFAERILCRSQGTLSDLLRNPKPWNRLKSGRETFRRMFNWLQQPLHIRLSILDMYKGPMGSGSIAPPTPAQNSRQNSKQRTNSGDENGHPHPKRPRLVFTDIQKRTLQAIFKETQRPSREMQQTIAEHLRLDMSTVSNFFMNARRRSRNGNAAGDEPAPYQQVRSITPPPESPPQSHQTPRNNASQSSRNRSFKSQSAIEQTVAEVVGRSAAYSQQLAQQGFGKDDSQGLGSGSLWDDELEDEDLEDFHEEDEEEGDDGEAMDHRHQQGSMSTNHPSTSSASHTMLISGPTSTTSSNTRNISVSNNKIITVKVEHEHSSAEATSSQQHMGRLQNALLNDDTNNGGGSDFLGDTRPGSSPQTAYHSQLEEEERPNNVEDEREQLADEEEEASGPGIGHRLILDRGDSAGDDEDDNANAPTMPGTPTGIGGSSALGSLSPPPTVAASLMNPKASPPESPGAIQSQQQP
ncbi:CUT domain-containing protein [Ditylenchus destructor]|nr:CUT domain-containing protein [Ditylenchus destructor]